MDRRTLGALLLTQVLFGLLPAASKVVFGALDPMAIAAWRALGGLATLILLVRIFAPHERVDWQRDGKLLAGLGLLGVVLNQGLFLVGLQFTTTVNATLVITSVPVFTYAIAVLMGRETLGPRRAVGILLALSGVFVLIGLSGYKGGWLQALGDLLVALNCLSFSFYLVLSKPLVSRMHPLLVTQWAFFFASLVLVPVGLMRGLIPDTLSMDRAQVAWLLFILLGPTAGTYALNATALRRVPASTVAVFIYLQPTFATMAAVWLLDETLTWRVLPAAVLIFTGVGIVARRSAVRAKEVQASSSS